MLTFNSAQAGFLRNQRDAYNAGQRNLHGNAAGLPVEFWRQVDRDIALVPRTILSVFNDLASSVSRAVPVGVVDHAFAVAGDSGAAHISLDGQWSGELDQAAFQNFSTAVPIFQDMFRLGWRDMEAARANGWSLDMASRDNSLNAVAIALEDAALVGSAKIVRNGVTMTGLTNHPSRLTRATSGTLNGATGAAWMTEMVATIKLLHAQNYRQPVTVYLNWDDWFYASNTDFSTAYPNKTILQRVQEIAGVAKFVPASRIAANTILAVVKERNVVQVLNAMPMAVVPLFRANDMDPYDFKTVAIAGIQLRPDANGKLGVAHSA